ncbi:MAG: aminotransferase class I/II-fold pyridoxal phosphate-dependent enzyme [Simkaniaceae bacterium]|nr:aminotransferase class I/II-fold pyridoxal phosphate-dependent enzyme [Simkaniaceae bacterium]
MSQVDFFVISNKGANVELIASSFAQTSEPYVFAKIKNSSNMFAIDLGIGDISEPLHPDIQEAFKEAIQEMSMRSIGYGPEVGHLFLRQAIAEKERVSPDEVFITDGICPSLSLFLNLLKPTCRVAIPSPAYPQYRSALTMRGMTQLVEIGDPCDVMILNSPNNPTGEAMSRDELGELVDKARSWKALILFDAAYEAFISSDEIPHSIFEIEGARECAIQFSSFSKSSGFTGLRCGYTIVPKNLAVHPIWKHYLETNTNGVAYPQQRAALKALEIGPRIEGYREGARILKEGLLELGQKVQGGEHCPYIWWENDDFDRLAQLGILAISGEVFGAKGFVRLSGFASHDNCKEAIRRLNG